MMKKTYLKLGFAILAIGTLLITSCAKQGCMDKNAKNYDAEAEEDDGSCDMYTNTELLSEGVLYQL